MKPEEEQEVEEHRQEAERYCNGGMGGRGLFWEPAEGKQHIWAEVD